MIKQKKDEPKRILLRYDSRDKIFRQRFGQVVEFPNEINFDSTLYDQVQPIGDVKCTAYTTCDIAEDQNGFEFDILDLWNRIPQYPDGADPRDVLGEAVKNGLLPVGKSERLKNWKSYWRADLGDMDAFDNVRSTMLLIRSSVGCGSYWYREWLNQEVLPVGKTPMNGHMYSVEGWKQINGEPHLIIEGWFGKKAYMSRAVFNQALKPVGMQAWTLSTAEMDTKKTKTLIEKIYDLLTNLYIILRNKLITKPVVVPEPVLPQPEATVEQPSYIWVNKESARHSVRVICDEYFLNWVEKDLICAVIEAESNFNPKAVNRNNNGTTDYGICQINDYYWIGEGKEFPSVQYVLDNPEASVRFMIKKYKAGYIKYWVAFTSGVYKKYLRG